MPGTPPSIIEGGTLDLGQGKVRTNYYLPKYLVAEMTALAQNPQSWPLVNPPTLLLTCARLASTINKVVHSDYARRHQIR